MRMNTGAPSRLHVPGAQYLRAEYVIDELGAQGAHRLGTLTTPQVLVLGILAGGFITPDNPCALTTGALAAWIPGGWSEPESGACPPGFWPGFDAGQCRWGSSSAAWPVTA